MGKTRTAFIGETAEEPKKEKHKKSLKEEKRVRVPGLKGGERVVAIGTELPEEPASAQKEEAKTPQITKVHAHKRSKRYAAALSQIDSSKKYSTAEAIELAKKTSTSGFDGKVELHLVLGKMGSASRRIEVALPHAEGLGKKRIEVANDQTVEKLKKGPGAIDFDILIATPSFIPKLVPFAKLLGPRGLMPNPKNGTIVEDPETAVSKFSGNTQILQTQKDAPLIHTVIGKLSDSDQNLAENLQSIVSAVGKPNIKKAVVAGTMGPGIKVDF